MSFMSTFDKVIGGGIRALDKGASFYRQNPIAQRARILSADMAMRAGGLKSIGLHAGIGAGIGAFGGGGYSAYNGDSAGGVGRGALRGALYGGLVGGGLRAGMGAYRSARGGALGDYAGMYKARGMGMYGDYKSQFMSGMDRAAKYNHVVSARGMRGTDPESYRMWRAGHVGTV